MPKNTHGYRICHRNMININLYPLTYHFEVDIWTDISWRSLESKVQDNDFKKYLSMANFI